MSVRSRRSFGGAATRALAVSSLLFLLTGFSDEAPEHATGAGTWKVWGGNLHNTHFAETETRIGRSNVASLRQKWVFETSGSVSAVPTVADDIVYVTDWG